LVVVLLKLQMEACGCVPRGLDRFKMALVFVVA